MGSGLYIIWLSDTHYYGGRSKNVEKRWESHLKELEKGTHGNRRMQAVFNKHGRFEPRLLAAVDLEAAIEEAEQSWLDEHFGQPGCVNLTPSAISPIPAGTKLSPETRARISASKIGNKSRLGGVLPVEARERISRALSGRTPSAETREKLSRAMAGNNHAVGAVFSAEAREKIAAANRGKPKSEETRRRISESKRASRNARLEKATATPVLI